MAYSMSVRNITYPQSPQAWLVNDVPWKAVIDYDDDPRFRAHVLAGDFDYYGVFSVQECLAWAQEYAAQFQPEKHPEHHLAQTHFALLEHLHQQGSSPVLVSICFWESGLD